MRQISAALKVLPPLCTFRYLSPEVAESNQLAGR